MIHILERKQVFIVGDDLPVGILQIERQAAELGTFPTVRASSETRLAHIALPAIAHAQRSVYEDFEQRIGTGAVDFPNLFQSQFASQHHLTESRLRQEAHFLRRAVIHLRAGMKRNGRQVEAGNAHILHDERIYADAVQVPNHRLGIFQLLILQNGIHRHVNARPIQMRITHQFRDVLQRVSRSGTRPEAGCPDIHGVRPMVDSLYPARQVFRGSQ